VSTVASLTALLVVIVNAAAGALGAWRWWRVEPSDAFWVLARAGQAAAAVLVLVAGVAYVMGSRPDDGLFWVYALTPVAVGFFAEQFRLISAQTVLDARGLENAQAMGRLPEAEQRSIVLQIVRRELGVVALSAGVVAFLALRAVTETSGL
jgi:hypothetical protein